MNYIPISERTFNFAVRIVKLCSFLDEKPGVSRTISPQLLKGARLSKILGYTTSRHTLLRLLLKLPLEREKNASVLGVDDWAYRKGRNYGTILVDLESHEPISLLTNRKSETLSKWLKEHPGVEVISRDRSLAYEKGARLGAPMAIQVADRFHLLKNLAEALEKVFMNHTKDLKTVEKALSSSLIVCEEGSMGVRVSPPPSPPLAIANAQKRHEKRWELYQEIIKLRDFNWSALAIAKKLGIGKTTVYRYLALKD